MLRELKETKVLASIPVAFVAAVAMITCLTFGNFWPSVQMNQQGLLK
jgi:hypothetical protein